MAALTEDKKMTLFKVLTFFKMQREEAGDETAALKDSVLPEL